MRRRVCPSPFVRFAPNNAPISVTTTSVVLRCIRHRFRHNFRPAIINATGGPNTTVRQISTTNRLRNHIGGFYYLPENFPLGAATNESSPAAESSSRLHKQRPKNPTEQRTGAGRLRSQLPS